MTNRDTDNVSQIFNNVNYSIDPIKFKELVNSQPQTEAIIRVQQWLNTTNIILLGKGIAGDKLILKEHDAQSYKKINH